MTQGQHYATSSYTEKRKSKSRKRTLIIALIAIAIIAVIGFVACQNLFGDKTGQVRQGAEIEVVIPAAPRPTRSPRFSSMTASSPRQRRSPIA